MSSYSVLPSGVYGVTFDRVVECYDFYSTLFYLLLHRSGSYSPVSAGLLAVFAF